MIRKLLVLKLIEKVYFYMSCIENSLFADIDNAEKRQLYYEVKDCLDHIEDIQTLIEKTHI